MYACRPSLGALSLFPVTHPAVVAVPFTRPSPTRPPWCDGAHGGGISKARRAGGMGWVERGAPHTLGSRGTLAGTSPGYLHRQRVTLAGPLRSYPPPTPARAPRPPPRQPPRKPPPHLTLGCLFGHWEVGGVVISVCGVDYPCGGLSR